MISQSYAPGTTPNARPLAPAALRQPNDRTGKHMAVAHLDRTADDALPTRSRAVGVLRELAAGYRGD